MDRIRIVLIGRNETFCHGLQAFLEGHADVESVVAAHSIGEGAALVGQVDPSVVLIDLDFPDDDGAAAVEAIRQQTAAKPIVALTAAAGEDALRAAMRAGALGCVLKDSHHTELIEALRTAAGHKRFVCGALATTILAGAPDGVGITPGIANEEVARLITHREREVLMRIALGQSNKLSARDLGLSVKTVEKHRSNLMRKLNLHNTAAVTMFALRHGLVDHEDARIG